MDMPTNWNDTKEPGVSVICTVFMELALSGWGLFSLFHVPVYTMLVSVSGKRPNLVELNILLCREGSQGYEHCPTVAIVVIFEPLE